MAGKGFTLSDRQRTVADQMGLQALRAIFPQGMPWGTKFADLEAVAVAIGMRVAQQIVENAAMEQADAYEESAASAKPACCPNCAKPLKPPKAAKHQLDTLAGKVEWHEPQGYCRHCRRSFFPAEPGAGDRN